MAPRVDPSREPGPVADPAAQLRRITAEIAKLRHVLPGSITARHTRCGRPGCRCMADPPRPHGPYWWWTRKVDNKTVTQILTDDQYADYGPWFDNARRLRELLAELEAVNLAIVEADPRTTQRRQPRPQAVDKPRSRRR